MALGDYFQVMFGLIAVLGLIGLAAVLARKAGLMSMPSLGVRTRRLSIVETMALDGRRRVVIIRNGEKEHLLLLGTQTETVIEAGLPVSEPVDAETSTSLPKANNPFAEFVKAHALKEAPKQDAA